MIAFTLPGWAALGNEGRGLVAVFADGAVVEDQRFRDWDRPGKTPILAGRRLDDPNNPVRLIARRGAQAVVPEAYLRFRNSDVLAGRIIGYQPGLDGGAEDAVILVEVESRLLGAGRDGRQLTVRASHVTDVVWQASGATDAPAPGVLRFVDGREVAADAIGWRSDGVRALGADAVINARFAELGAVSFPRVGPPRVLGWEDRADPRGLTMTAQLRNGSRLTGGMGQLQYEQAGRRGAKEGRHFLQPPWATQVIGYAIEDGVSWTVRRRDEVPLGRFPSELIEQRNSTGYVRHPQIGRAVGGGALAVGDLASAHGIGMHARATLAFELPESARSLRGWVGIDESVGNGGCAEAAVYLNKRPRVEGDPAWRSKHLLGSQEAVGFGPIDLGDRRHVLLHAGDGHDKRPAGADPLDIRDHVAWLSPVVRLAPDPAPKTLAGVVPGGASWQIEGAKHLAVGARYDKDRRAWLPEVHTDREGVAFVRRVAVGPASGVLDLQLRHLTDKPGLSVAVMAEGKPLAGFGKDGVHVFQGRPSRDGTRFLVDLTHLGTGSHDLRIEITQERDRPDLKSPGLVVMRCAVRPIVEGRLSGLPRRPDVPLLSIKPEPIDDKTFPTVTVGQLSDGTPIRVRGVARPRALAVPGDKRLGFRVPAGATRLVAVIAGEGERVGPRLVIQADGKTLYDQQLQQTVLMPQIDLALPAGAERIEIRTARGDGHTLLLDPGFMMD